MCTCRLLNHSFPRPTKSHYVFNLRDYARVIRGILLVPPTRMAETDKVDPSVGA